MPIKEYDNGHPQTTDADSYSTTRIYHVWSMTDAELYATAGLTDPIGNFSRQDLVEFAVRAVAPDTIAGSPVTAIESNDKQDPGEWYEVTLTYSSGSASSSGNTGPEPEEGTSSVSIEIGTQTINMQRAIGTTIFTEPGEDPVPWNGIEPTTDDPTDPKFRGADVVVPNFGWNETHFHPDSTFVWSDLYNYVGRMNATPFRGFAAGEVLLFGISGSIRYDTDPLLWETSYTFGAAPNLTGETIGLVTGVDKRGWDYLWVTYKDVSGTPTVNSVYVEQVYKEANFLGLGIGVA